MPVAPGDLFSGEYMGYEHPRIAAAQPEYEALYLKEEDGGGYTCLQDVDSCPEAALPWDLWCVLYHHPGDKKLWFCVPWTGDKESYNKAITNDASPEAGALYLPVTSECIHDSFRGRQMMLVVRPEPVYLFLGHGRWIPESDMSYETRFQHLTPEGLKTALDEAHKQIGGRLK
jgi:hypothetical protein